MPTARDLRHLAHPRIRKNFDVTTFGGDIENPGNFDALAFYRKTLAKVRRSGRPDGLIGDDDYPANLIAGLLTKELKLSGPSLRSLLLCQHKLYSRMAQARSVPEATPKFFHIPLDRLLKPSEIPLKFPFFVKPVKGYLSILSRKVRSYREFKEIVREGRRRIPHFTGPFDRLLKKSGLKMDFPLGGDNLIGEEILKGHQVTLEGYACQKKVHGVDIVDSVFYPGTASFKRFEAPSRLPSAVQSRMFRTAEKFIRAIGFDNSIFNMEFVYNSRTRQAHILEVNSRMASQFADMMEALHGTNTYEILLSLGAGRRPEFRRHRGKSKIAASFVLRRFKDGFVESVPSKQRIRKLQEKFPGTGIEILVEPGRRLSSHFQQDDESYRYALINLSAKSRPELFRKYRACLKALPFKFSTVRR